MVARRLGKLVERGLGCAAGALQHVWIRKVTGTMGVANAGMGAQLGREHPPPGVRVQTILTAVSSSKFCQQTRLGVCGAFCRQSRIRRGMTDASAMPAAAASACRRGGGGRVQQNGPSNSESVSFPGIGKPCHQRTECAPRQGKYLKPNTCYLPSALAFEVAAARFSRFLKVSRPPCCAPASAAAAASSRGRLFVQGPPPHCCRIFSRNCAPSAATTI